MFFTFRNHHFIRGWSMTISFLRSLMACLLTSGSFMIVNGACAQAQPGQFVPAGGQPQRMQQAAPQSPAPVTPSGTTATLPPPPGSPDDPQYKSAIGSAFPFSPEQIEDIGRRVDGIQRAMDKPSTPPPTPSLTSIAVSLDPGSKPPVVALYRETATVLNFTDITGAPWPIIGSSNGNPREVNLQVPIEGGSMAILAPLGNYPTGNVVFILKDAPRPVIFQIVSAITTKERQVDYNKDVIVEARGPQAQPSLISGRGTPSAANPSLLAVLNGVPPSGAVRLKVNGDPSGKSRAWQLGNRILLRTALSVLSPAWLEIQNAPGLVNGERLVAYALPNVPVALAIDQGQPVSLSFSE
jgi:intracellular multiplication protein IcmK